VPGNVVAVGVRDERPGLPPAKVDRQVGLREFQPAVPVEQAFPLCVIRGGFL
jgi:hypothetical protein